MGFTKAVRTQSRLRVALCGPAGSGKTWSSLELAAGLAEKIGSRVALIDSESGSSNLYANQFDFDSMDLPAEASVDSYIRAMREAAAAGYKVLIIDSISHEWDSVLRVVDNAGGGKFGAWKDATPLHDSFINAIKDFPGHVFATIRSKTAYEVGQDANGKKTITKLGLAPKQRDGVEFEFDAFLDLDVSNNCHSTKDRLHLFDDPRILSRQDGAMLGDWVLGIETEIEARNREFLEAVANARIRARVLKSKEEFFRVKGELLAKWGFDAKDKDGKPARFLPAPMQEAMAEEYAAFEARGNKPETTGEGE